MMVKRVLQGEGSFHALDAIERGLNALAEAEANRDPLACPECDFVAAHARGLARHRGAKHGVESKIAARRRIASIPCPLCEEKLLTKSGLTTHMIRVHELTDKEERERILMGAQIVDEYKDDLVKLAEEEPEKVEVVVEDPAAAYRRVYPSQVIPLPEPVEEPEVGVEVVADEDYTPPQRKPKKVLDVFDTPLLKLALLIDPAYREEGLVLLEQLADQL